jgi:hypothetical protein
VSYRAGDLWVPRLDQLEALTRETQYFVDCILNHLEIASENEHGIIATQGDGVRARERDVPHE